MSDPEKISQGLLKAGYCYNPGGWVVKRKDIFISDVVKHYGPGKFKVLQFVVPKKPLFLERYFKQVFYRDTALEDFFYPRGQAPLKPETDTKPVLAAVELYVFYLWTALVFGRENGWLKNIKKKKAIQDEKANFFQSGPFFIPVCPIKHV